MSKNFPEISVSVLNMDFTCLRDSIREVEKGSVDSFHLDIMDGHLVDNISFGPDISRTIISASSVPVHSHLMIENPERFVERFFEAGTDSVTVHVEALNESNRYIMEKERMGISLNPDVSIESIDPYLGKVERVLVMSVMAGFGGQSFIKKSLERIKLLSEKRKKGNFNFLIEVDGGVNGEVARQCASAGADVVVIGSWITLSDDPAGRLKQLRSL